MKRAPQKLPPGTVGVAQAKRDLIALIDRILKSGKPVTISRRGKPVVQIVPLPNPTFWKWSPENAIPENDPFWEGEKITRAWRKQVRPWRKIE